MHMALLSSLFLGTFVILYTALFPLFRRPVIATYVVIFLMMSFFSVKLFRYLRQRSFSKLSLKQKLGLLLLWGVEVYLILMLVWYVFVHFKTYQIM